MPSPRERGTALGVGQTGRPTTKPDTLRPARPRHSPSRNEQDTIPAYRPATRQASRWFDNAVGPVHEPGPLEPGRRPTVPHVATTDRPRRTRLLIALSMLAAALVGVIGLQAESASATAGGHLRRRRRDRLHRRDPAEHRRTRRRRHHHGVERGRRLRGVGHHRRQRHVGRRHPRTGALHGRARRVDAPLDRGPRGLGGEPGRAARRRRRLVDRRLQPRAGRHAEHRRQLVDHDGHRHPHAAAPAVRARHPVRPDPRPRRGRALPHLRHHRDVQLLARRAGHPGRPADVRVLHPAALADRPVGAGRGDPLAPPAAGSRTWASGNRCGDAEWAWSS